jgi:hypothetical protein
MNRKTLWIVGIGLYLLYEWQKAKAQTDMMYGPWPLDTEPQPYWSGDPNVVPYAGTSPGA